MAYNIKGDLSVARNINSQLMSAFGYDTIATNIPVVTGIPTVVDMLFPERKHTILITNTSTGNVVIDTPINAIGDADHVYYVLENSDTITRTVVMNALYVRPDGTSVGSLSISAGSSRIIKAYREDATKWVVTEDTAYGPVPGNTRVFASNTAVAPTTSGHPTVSEIQAYVTTNSIIDTLVYYTGTDISTDPTTYAFWVDQAGVATIVENTPADEVLPFGRMELTNNTVTAALGVAANSATISVAAATPSVLPFSKITHQEGGMVATLGTWTDGSAGGQAATGTRMSFTIPVGGAGEYRYSMTTPNPVDGDIATGNAPSYGIAVNGSIAQVFDIKSGDGDVSGFSGIITLAAGDVVQPVVVIEGSDAEAYDVAVTFGSGSLSGYPTVVGADVVYAFFELEKRNNTQKVMAGMVAPVSLGFWQARQAATGPLVNIAGLTFPSTADVYGVSGNLLNFSGATKSVFNLGSFNDVGNTTVVIQKAGRYRLSSSVTMDGSATNRHYSNIQINGTVVSQGASVSGSADEPNSITNHYVADLSVGDVIGFAVYGNVSVQVSAYNLTIEEVATAIVVDPASVTPVSLHRTSMATNETGFAFVSAAATTIGTGYNVMVLSDAQWSAIYNPNLTIRTANNSIEVLQAGTYRITAHAETDASSPTQKLTLYRNGARIAGAAGTNLTVNSAVQSLSVIVDLLAGDDLEFGEETTTTTQWKRPNITVEQLPEYTVVIPDSVSVADQAASGYFDIGDMRIQWGSATGGTVVTLPAAFANATYSIMGSAAALGAGTNLAFHHDTVTTTSFIGSLRDTTGVSVASPWTWMAIGLKP